VGSAQTIQIKFAASGGDNIGMLLDNVDLSQVPEPGMCAIWCVLGLTASGTCLRRRRPRC
jgi:hypothetical protein